MEKQERKQEVRREPQGKEEVKANPKVVETGKKLKEDIDKLVDEIDDVLEKNAEEFVKNYVQKGGEYLALPRASYRTLYSSPFLCWFDKAPVSL